jgi:hypothetical protein
LDAQSTGDSNGKISFLLPNDMSLRLSHALQGTKIFFLLQIDLRPFSHEAAKWFCHENASSSSYAIHDLIHLLFRGSR